ncbi:hypothetical protein GCM10014713_28710 [Streptomyces purpureus]|uniref:Uncharacterized protein n=1 Tax=Streptomyces purpureus TaxID=1951 RepID=A0A918H4H4_9ACTN|nr:hypothetical protein GCM10014713_28710 [Streptomyces purpureus]
MCGNTAPTVRGTVGAVVFTQVTDGLRRRGRRGVRVVKVSSGKAGYAAQPKRLKDVNPTPIFTLAAVANGVVALPVPL